MANSTVYFTNELTPEAVVKMYRQLGIELPGKVAVKVHSGEDGNQNYLHPEFMKPVIDAVNGTVVECNTAYGGARNETPKHIELMKKHHWSDLFDVDIMDAEGPDVEWPVENGKVLKVNYLGKNIENYDSMLVLIHFKGHPMGGYGGALKNISIGIASSYGKKYIHGVKNTEDYWHADRDSFLECMADAAKSIVDHFGGKMAFVNIMKNMSVDCDCCAVAEDPKLGDIGILSSLDPVALDQACLDLVYASDDPGKGDLIKRIESRNGVHTIEAAAALGVGSREYELITL
jgi:uncharacterized Fe-S center protein